MDLHRLEDFRHYVFIIWLVCHILFYPRLHHQIIFILCTDQIWHTRNCHTLIITIISGWAWACCGFQEVIAKCHIIIQANSCCKEKINWLQNASTLVNVPFAFWGKPSFYSVISSYHVKWELDKTKKTHTVLVRGDYYGMLDVLGVESFCCLVWILSSFCI